MIYILASNLLGFSLMVYDKNQAVKRKNRISESTFCILSALGGIIGIIIGANFKNHKTSKRSFWVKVLISFLLGITVFILIKGELI